MMLCGVEEQLVKNTELINQKEKISIVMPAHNAENTIQDAIKSVLEQTYQNFELIIINNGSNDRTDEICQKIMEENKQKIVYKNIETPGVSHARNIGIEEANGKYICFIDADDKYDNNFIANMLEKLESKNYDIVTCGYKTVGLRNQTILLEKSFEKDSSSLEYYLEELKENYLFNQLWNKIYITDKIKENKIVFDEEIELGEDMLFNIEYMRYVDTMYYLNEPLYLYTESQSGLNLKYRKDKFEIEYKLTKKLEEFYKEKKYNMQYIYNRYARVYYNAIMNIYAKSNKIKFKEKNKQLDDFINSKIYKEDIEKLKNKITDKKLKISFNKIFSKSRNRIVMFVMILKIRG